MTVHLADGRSFGKKLLLITSICAPFPVLAQSAAPSQDAAAQNSGLEDFIVTAQKREESLQDMPISITTFSSAALEANRVQNVQDLSALTPNLTVQTNGGGSSSVNFTIGGIG